MHTGVHMERQKILQTGNFSLTQDALHSKTKCYLRTTQPAHLIKWYASYQNCVVCSTFQNRKRTKCKVFLTLSWAYFLR